MWVGFFISFILTRYKQRKKGSLPVRFTGNDIWTPLKINNFLLNLYLGVYQPDTLLC